MIQKKSLLLVGILSMVLLTGMTIVLGSSYAQFTYDDFSESVNSYSDEFSYLCLNLESLGGLDEDNDQVREDVKQDCKEQIKDIDFFKKKELIKKYGELDE